MFLTLLIVISNIHCNNINDTMKILITIIISSLFISCIYMSVYECVHVIEVLHFTLRFFPLRILLYMYTYIYLVTY